MTVRIVDTGNVTIECRDCGKEVVMPVIVAGMGWSLCVDCAIFKDNPNIKLVKPEAK
jgi:hypothetical protein